MSKLAYEIKKLECLPFDRRVVERNLTTGVVSRKDYEKHVHALKDLIDESEEFQVTVGPEEETKAALEAAKLIQKLSKKTTQLRTKKTLPTTHPPPDSTPWRAPRLRAQGNRWAAPPPSRLTAGL